MGEMRKELDVLIQSMKEEVPEASERSFRKPSSGIRQGMDWQSY